MTTASEKMIQAIEYVVKPISVGTNLALLHLLWAMVSGAFLPSRGAVHTALNLSGRTDDEVRRGGQALRTGQWTIGELIGRWREWVKKESEWELKRHEGWTAVSCDVVVYPRLKLKGWVGKFYRGTFGRAIKGIGLGVIVDVGHYEGERVPLLRKIVRCKNDEKSGTQLQQQLFKEAGKHLGEKEVVVHDAGGTLKAMEQAGIKWRLIRLAKNCVARRSELPENAHGSRQYGEIVRPLERSRKENKIAATDDPDVRTTFEYKGRTIKVWGWLNVVGKEDKVADKATPYHIWVFFDPLYEKHDPLILATNLPPEEASPSTIFNLYLDRWPVEQLPLAGKQMVGLHRQFVFNLNSCFRLPELSLLAGNMLTHIAHLLPAYPTGYWDRAPKKTPGRLRRVLARDGFPENYALHARIRPKASKTDHLPKGVDAHRRKKKAEPT